MRIILHGKDLAVPEMTGPMSAAVLKGALNHLLAQEVTTSMLSLLPRISDLCWKSPSHRSACDVMPACTDV